MHDKPTWDPKADGWFSGFADGESCFAFNGQFQPRFTLTLRLDDIVVLQTLQEAFGGGISIATRRSQGSRPQAQWHVGSKPDILGLVAYFDAFPLRAKKANDYGVWRRAVLAYCEGGASHPDLPALRRDLVSARVYVEPSLSLPKARANAGKTHCPKGHPYVGTNLRIQSDGARRCRTCKRERERSR